MNDYKKIKKILFDSPLRMRMMIKTSIAISAKGIEINFVFGLLKTTSIAVENLIPSSGRVHLICNRPCNLITVC